MIEVRWMILFSLALLCNPTFSLLSPSFIDPKKILGNECLYHLKHYYPCRPEVGHRSRRTILNLGIGSGIRSFLGKGRKYDDPNEEEDDFSPMESAPKGSPLSEQREAHIGASEPEGPEAQTPAPQRPLRMGEDPRTGMVNVHALDKKESVQERINRVKSGKMTEEEKEAFLAMALTAGNRIEIRRPLFVSSSKKGEEKKRISASPFPKDSIIRNFARGKNATTSRDDVVETYGIDSQKKKRDYVKMVTDPGRFGRYKTYSSSFQTSGGVMKIPDEGFYDPVESDPYSDYEQSSQQNSVAPMPVDLGARLGAAALATESMRKQFEEERKEKEKKKEEEMRAYERNMAELSRQRQDELVRREAEMRERRQREEEALMKAREERNRLEKERLDQLMKAQEEYWTKRLSEERAAKAKAMDRKGKDDDENEPEESSSKAQHPVADLGKKEEGMVVPKSTVPFNPDESVLLELAQQDRDESWDENQQIMSRSASRIAGTPQYLNDVQSERQFMDEQTQKKQAMDKTRDDQLQRLKALNSPLPNPVAVAPQRGRASSRSSSSTFTPSPFQPQRSVSSPPSRPVTNSLFQVTSGKIPRLGQNDAVDRKKSIAEVMRERTKEVATPPPPSSPPPPPPQQEPKSWSLPFTSTRRDPVETEKESPPEPPVRRGPIRMQLPLGDDEEEGPDSEDGVDVRSQKKISVADAMKRTKGSVGNQDERSKKWGIDMSRFVD